MMKKKLLLFFVFLLCLMQGVSFSLCAPVGDGESQIVFEVPAGTGASQAARNLKEKGLISNTTFFRLYLRLTGRAAQIQTGTYNLHNGLWLSEIAEKLSSGKVRLHPITIPEGWNNRQIGDFFVEKGLAASREDFLAISRDPKILREYGIQTSSTEGYLYPETYFIPDYYSADKLHRLMLDKFFSVLKKLGSKEYSPDELLQKIILASIVEREARHPQERPTIARVFLNRLQMKMKLESCATVQYLFPKPKAKLYLRDLAKPSPYNTYIHYGLPPAPISNPGLAALKAAFAPEKNDYLYFVVKPGGTHHFSQSYGNHIRAKKKYIDSDIVEAR